MKRFFYPDDLGKFNEVLERGEKANIDNSMFDYYLEVLPPVYMGKMVTLCDGNKIYASFGFVEGEDVIVAFWVEKTPLGRRYYAQRTNQRSRG